MGIGELIGIIAFVALILYFALRKRSKVSNVNNNDNKNNVVVNVYNNQEPKSEVIKDDKETK